MPESGKFDWRKEIPVFDLSKDYASEPEKKKTSDALAKEAKTFLKENDIRRNIFNKPSFEILGNVLKLRLPKKDEQIRYRTQQQMNLISMVLKIVDVHKKIDALTIATYTLNRLAIETLSDLVRAGKVSALNLLVSSSYGFRDKKYFQELKNYALNLSREFNVHLVFAWCHFKITLAKCGDNYYQIEGSMNYSTNNMAEQLLFENNKKSYFYDYDFITKAMVDKKTKHLRWCVNEPAEITIQCEKDEENIPGLERKPKRTRICRGEYCSHKIN